MNGMNLLQGLGYIYVNGYQMVGGLTISPLEGWGRLEGKVVRDDETRWRMRMFQHGVMSKGQKGRHGEHGRRKVVADYLVVRWRWMTSEVIGSRGEGDVPSRSRC